MNRKRDVSTVYLSMKDSKLFFNWSVFNFVIFLVSGQSFVSAIIWDLFSFNVNGLLMSGEVHDNDESLMHKRLL